MTDIVLRQQFAAAGTGAHTRTVGQSLAVQTDGMTVTVQGSNVPEDASSWQTIGTASGFTATPLTTPLAFLRVVADGAGIVSISAADGAAGGGGGGGGAGDASAANQTTQITAAATTNTRLGDVTETAPATDTASSGINGRLQRVAQRLTSLIANIPALTVTATRLLVDGSGVTQPVSAASLPLPTGAATAANQSSELTLVGAITETAPGTDTASSGLNGRLQRIAQRLTSLIGVLPASLGAKTAANSLSTTPATDAVFITANVNVNPTANFTRPADTTAYASGDTVANSVTAGSVTPLTLTAARVAAGTFMCHRLKLHKSGTSVTNAAFRVHLFKTSPTSASGDNAAISMTGVAGYLGYVDIVIDQAFTDGAAGFSSLAMSDTIVSLASGTSLFALLEARAAYTPISAEVFTLTAEITQD